MRIMPLFLCHSLLLCRCINVMLSAAKHLSLITLLRPFGRLRLTRRGRAAHINVPTTEAVQQPTIAAGRCPVSRQDRF